MRARNIKPGFFDNEVLAECSFQARLLFIGLWCLADREGLFEWRPKRIKAKIFPYEDVKKCNVIKLLGELEQRHFVKRYSVNGGEYGYLPTFLHHQKPHPHEKQSEFPTPTDDVIKCNDMSLHDTKCKPDSLNEDSLNEDSRNEEYSAPSSGGNSEPNQDAVITIPLQDKTEYPVFQKDIDEWTDSYPAVDVLIDLKKMREWCISNPRKKKTKKGVRGFITNWLARTQDRGGNKSTNWSSEEDAKRRFLESD